jgi:hypothetical protein
MVLDQRASCFEAQDGLLRLCGHEEMIGGIPRKSESGIDQFSL